MNREENRGTDGGREEGWRREGGGREEGWREREMEREMENMFSLFAPICLCGSALTSMWAEYVKRRLITLPPPRRNKMAASV